MSEATKQVHYFYDRHPISSEIILSKVTAARGDLNRLTPDDLFPYDQDHYGGLEATDTLAIAARIGKGSRVVDFCAGLGGTVRYLAYRYDATVVGVELTPSRVQGANKLTELVGLQDVASVIEGSVLSVPFPNASIDAVVSQEAFLHVPDVSRALIEAHRILRDGGVLAFTDWVANEPLSRDDAQLMWDGMAVQPLRSISEYRRLVESTGFRTVSVTDLTDEWGPILKQRLAMYQRLREDAERLGTPMGHDAFHQSYVRFVELVQKRTLGGVRVVAEK